MGLIGVRGSPVSTVKEERYTTTSLSNAYEAGTSHVTYNGAPPFAFDGIDVAIKVNGSPDGTGGSRNPPAFLKAGDYVDVTVSGIGNLKNSVGAE
jgi:hypothetical protein